MKLPTILFVSLLVFGASALAASPATPGANVYIISPAQGETVSSPVKIVFGLGGMGVAPAGMEKTGTGHHHLLIDAGLPVLGRPIPSDHNHRHFGGGQTETVIELAPGEHSLQLLLADFSHLPHNPAVLSKPITITVE